MSELNICWIGQSGYLLSDSKHEICIDPYLSNAVDRVAHRGRMVMPPISPEKLKSDVVVCTHNHLDHLDIDAIPLMKKEKMLFLAPLDAKATLLSCGVTNYKAFDEGTTFQLGDFSLEAVFADHTVPTVGILVRHGEKTLYFTSDTEYNEKLEKISKRNVDVLFVCINGKLGNMSVDEAVKLTKIINPSVGVPTHYGMFESNTEDPKRYTSQVASSFEMEHGRKYTISEVMGNV